MFSLNVCLIFAGTCTLHSGSFNNLSAITFGSICRYTLLLGFAKRRPAVHLKAHGPTARGPVYSFLSSSSTYEHLYVQACIYRIKRFSLRKKQQLQGSQRIKMIEITNESSLTVVHRQVGRLHSHAAARAAGRGPWAAF